MHLTAAAYAVYKQRHKTASGCTHIAAICIWSSWPGAQLSVATLTDWIQMIRRPGAQADRNVFEWYNHRYRLIS